MLQARSLHAECFAISLSEQEYRIGVCKIQLLKQESSLFPYVPSIIEVARFAYFDLVKPKVT